MGRQMLLSGDAQGMCRPARETLQALGKSNLHRTRRKAVQQYLDAIKKGHTPEPINKMVAVMLYQRMICGVIPKQLTGEEHHTRLFAVPTG